MAALAVPAFPGVAPPAAEREGAAVPRCPRRRSSGGPVSLRSAAPSLSGAAHLLWPRGPPGAEGPGAGRPAGLWPKPLYGLRNRYLRVLE